MKAKTNVSKLSEQRKRKAPATSAAPEQPKQVLGVFKCKRGLPAGSNAYANPQDGTLRHEQSSPDQKPFICHDGFWSDEEVALMSDGKAYKLTDAIKAQIAQQNTAAGMTRDAEMRRQVMQSEAAINIGIGMTLLAMGQREVTISIDAIANFNLKHKVGSVANLDGSYTLTVLDR